MLIQMLVLSEKKKNENVDKYYEYDREVNNNKLTKKCDRTYIVVVTADHVSVRHLVTEAVAGLVGVVLPVHRLAVLVHDLQVTGSVLHHGRGDLGRERGLGGGGLGQSQGRKGCAGQLTLGLTDQGAGFGCGSVKNKDYS